VKRQNAARKSRQETLQKTPSPNPDDLFVYREESVETVFLFGSGAWFFHMLGHNNKPVLETGF